MKNLLLILICLLSFVLIFLGVKFKVEISETVGEVRKRMSASSSEKAETDGLNSANTPGGADCETFKKVISRTDFERFLKNPNEIYRGIRFGPQLVEGKIDGYKIYHISVNHIFYQLGTRDGDIAKRVNGVSLSETEKMLEIWSSVKNSTNVTIDIDRKGKCFTYEIVIQN